MIILPNSPLIQFNSPNSILFVNTQKNPLQFLAQKHCSCNYKGQKLVLEYKDNSGLMELFRRVKMGIGCFGNWKEKQQELGKKVETTDNVAGGQDVMDSAMAQAKLNPHHLVIMVNGLIGSSSDWKFASDQFVKQFPDKVMVHRSRCNTAKLTFDGVDLMGERLADEVLTVVSGRPGLEKISFIAHSLGGLVARYAIGRLYKPSEKTYPSIAKSNGFGEENLSSIGVRDQGGSEGRIAGLEPMNFITVATPHLGSRGHKQLPFLCGVPFLERQASQTAHLIAGRSGKHLFLTDENEGRTPLLVRMVSDSYELKFISALRCFKRRVAYANADYDQVVGWSTSSIRRRHELPKANLLGQGDKYPHIVYTECDAKEDDQRKTASDDENQIEDYEEEMIRGLNQVPWERIDVSFHKSRQRYIAHNTIQVKSYWLNSDGEDVIYHMIDNFLV
ncbi:uncharacterized protein LOC141592441 [Silene latifolia]|uniref:uncharacterized protein LOC141592441 n=1 Tax=Silene latifolia TaxID=37657 RepID=UPI003D77EBBC